MAHTTSSQMYITVSLVSNTFCYFQETLPKDLFHTTSVKLHTIILNYQSLAGMDTILASYVLLADMFLLACDQGYCNDQNFHYYWNRNRASWYATRPPTMTY